MKKLERDDGTVFLTATLYKGMPAVRAAFSNWQTVSNDIELTCEAITPVWESLQIEVRPDADPI